MIHFLFVFATSVPGKSTVYFKIFFKNLRLANNRSKCKQTEDRQIHVFSDLHYLIKDKVKLFLRMLKKSIFLILVNYYQKSVSYVVQGVSYAIPVTREKKRLFIQFFHLKVIILIYIYITSMKKNHFANIFFNHLWLSCCQYLNFSKSG